jgi:hypothetical protein
VQATTSTDRSNKRKLQAFLQQVNGAGEGIRTPDPLITNQMLYQLSYAGILCVFWTPTEYGMTESIARCGSLELSSEFNL